MLFRSVLMRLKGACKQKFMIACQEEVRGMDKKNKLKITVGDLLYIMERFDEGYKIFESVSRDDSASEAARAYAWVGMSNCIRLKEFDDIDKKIRNDEKAIVCCKKGFELYPKTLAAAHAMRDYAYLMSYAGNKEKNEKALEAFYDCYRKYPDTTYGEESLFRLIMINFHNNGDWEKYARIYKKKYPKGFYLQGIESLNKKQKGGKES